MSPISTNNLILLKAYDELNDLGNIELDAILGSSVEANENFLLIKEMKSILDGGYENPNPTSIQLILEASMLDELETH